MKYDFAHPKFKNGMVTFNEKKPDLVYEFRLEAWRREYELKPDMILYSPDKVRIAKVQNYGHMLLITMLNTKKIKKIFNKMEIEQFFNKINENTVFNRKIGMNLNEAKQILKSAGYLVENSYDNKMELLHCSGDWNITDLDEYIENVKDWMIEDKRIDPSQITTVYLNNFYRYEIKILKNKHELTSRETANILIDFELDPKSAKENYGYLFDEFNEEEI